MVAQGTEISGSLGAFGLAAFRGINAIQELPLELAAAESAISASEAFSAVGEAAILGVGLAGGIVVGVAVVGTSVAIYELIAPNATCGNSG